MKILVVDDDNVVRNLIKDLLELNGYQVITAENGRVAWEYLLKNRVEICISDVNMPEMEGWELLRRVRTDKNIQDIFFIMLTIREFASDKVFGYECGADDYLTKPFENEALLARVKAFEKRVKPV